MTKPKICVSIAAGGGIQAAETIRSVEPFKPDLIELRIDYLKNLEGLREIRESTDLPLIATNRRVEQGGRFLGQEARRVSELLKACEAGFDYADLELTTPSLTSVADEVKGLGAKLIISFHDLRRTPSNQGLDKVLAQEIDLDPDICKIVGTAESYLDNLTYLNFLKKKPNIRLICFAMGRLGIVSRILSPLFGSEFTYASAGAGLEVASGQLTIHVLRDIYRMLGV